MENKVKFIQSTTYILCGSLLQACGNIADGWSGALVAIAGFALFYIGLGNLAIGFDPAGRKAVGLLRTAAMIGAVGGLIDLIPLMGVFAGILYIVAFVVEIVGLLQLKDNPSLGFEGKSAVSQLIVANMLAVVAALLGILPFVGGFLAAILYLGVMALAISGWLKIQRVIIIGLESGGA